MNPIQYQQWQEPNFRAVNKFYRSQKHKGSASGNDIVYVAYNEDELVGAVRLVPYDNYYWLRGLYIASVLRNQGIGHTLMMHASEHTRWPIYCFPYKHLINFYRQVDYVQLAPEQLPNALQQLYQRHQQKSDNIAAMGIHLQP
ncbi:GNAT family N-acetyltransferase [Bermanella sp. R86510]|uniref:GNAT family N-acetyltransferase n=1 Tax=unclassified Bermanella TaxID=2627862 RepID=UPI0037C5C889